MRRQSAWMVGVMLATTALSAQERGVQIPAAVRETQGVLIAAFPELREGRVAWRITTTATGVEVEARQPGTPFADQTTTAPVVAAMVSIDEQGRLAALAARGTLIDDARQKAAPRSGDVDADLAAVGAKFPPSDAAAREVLVPVGLPRALGAATVRETTFRAEGTVEAPQDARTWRVELETDDADRRPYTLVFEPVEGRLLSVVRR
jgi:hypothetical protein